MHGVHMHVHNNYNTITKIMKFVVEEFDRLNKFISHNFYEVPLFQTKNNSTCLNECNASLYAHALSKDKTMNE